MPILTMGSNSGNYREEPPDDYPKSKDEWLNLSYSGQYYHYNKRDQLEYNRARKIRSRELIKSIKDELSCTICDESHNSTLDFHHLEDKEIGVAELSYSTYSQERIVEEIRKCVVLCANCHRKYHAGDIDLGDIEKDLSGSTIDNISGV